MSDRLEFYSSHDSLADFLSSEYVERIVEETVYGFLEAIFHPSSLTPSVFITIFRLRSFYVRLCEIHDCSLQLQLADSWLAILDRYYLHVFTVFATLNSTFALELFMIKLRENFNYLCNIFFSKELNNIHRSFTFAINVIHEINSIMQ